MKAEEEKNEKLEQQLNDDELDSVAGGEGYPRIIAVDNKLARELQGTHLVNLLKKPT